MRVASEKAVRRTDSERFDKELPGIGLGIAHSGALTGLVQERFHVALRSKRDNQHIREILGRIPHLFYARCRKSILNGDPVGTRKKTNYGSLRQDIALTLLNITTLNSNSRRTPKYLNTVHDCR